MITHPNQRVVHICTKKVTKDFIQIAKEDMKAACRNLTPAQFIVWQILAGNAEGYDFIFSPAAIEKEYGISKQTVQNAFKVLIEKGYLEPTKSSTHFRFHLKPHSKGSEPCEAANLEISSCEVSSMAEMFKECKQLDLSSSAEKKDWIKELM